MVFQKSVGNYGTVSCHSEQPAKIRSGAPVYRLAGHRDRYHHRGRYFGGSVRLHYQPVHRFPAGGRRKNHTDLYIGRHKKRCFFQGCAARFHSHHFKRHESQYRSGSGGGYHRGISGRPPGTGLSDYLWQPGFPASSCDYQHYHSLCHRHGTLPDDPVSGTLV